MPKIELVTVVRAPAAVVFDAARDVEVHLHSLPRTCERVIAGVTNGLISGGDSVTWRARYFGVWWTLSSRVDVFEPPHRFRDVMVSGPFARFEHDHFFDQVGELTTMTDLVVYAAPLGLLGRIAERLFLHRTVRGIIEARAAAIRSAAERD
jgi:ligand-binding SRPBCC domain-containing protein